MDEIQVCDALLHQEDYWLQKFIAKHLTMLALKIAIAVTMKASACIVGLK